MRRAAILVAATTLVATPAWGEVGLELRAGGEVTILSERHTLRCDDFACDHEIRLQATSETSPTVLAVTDPLAERTRPATITGARVVLIDRHPADDPRRRHYFVVNRPGVAFDLVVRSGFGISTHRVADELEPPIWVRHPLVAGSPSGDRHASFSIRPAIAGKRERPANVLVEVPAGRALTCTAFVARDGSLRPSGACDADPESSRIFWIAEDGRDRPFARIEVRTGPPRSSWGGPFVAIGGTFGEGFRTRLGWDVGLLPWLIGSVSGETDFSEVVGGAVLLELASALPWGAPWLGLGLGPSVAFTPETRVRARAQLHLHLYLIGATVSVDLPDAQVSLFGTIAI